MLLAVLLVAAGPATGALADEQDGTTAPGVAVPAAVAAPALPGARATDLLATGNPVLQAGEGAATATDTAASRIVERMLAEIRSSEAEPRRLGLAEAVRLAVENNPGIRGRAEIPRRDAYAPLGATGAFDPKFRVNATARSLRAPAGNALVSGTSVLDEEDVRTEVSISKLLRSGASVDLAWTSRILDTNSAFYTLSPAYDNRLGLTLRQPLLRNFWAAEENTTVLVSRSEAEESLAAFEADLARFVSGVVDAYWEVVRATAELEVARRSVLLAREIVRDADLKVKSGLLPEVAVKESQADAAAREERAIAAENDLVVAGRDLQYQVMLGALDNRAPDPVLPAEEHVVTPVDLDRAGSLATAVECRSEIRGASFALGRRQLEEKRARNRRLPSLDLVARYNVFGLAGDVQPIRDLEGNIVLSPYGGDYGDSFGDMFSSDFNEYAVGLQLEVPLGNASARADLAQAGIEVRRASRDLEQAVSSVSLEVDRALADVASAAKRVAASRSARELAEENLRHQGQRFENGMVTTKDVLDYQERLESAQASEVRAITDHAEALTRLRVADGTLLARFGLEIRSPDAPGEPWWYRF